MKWGFFEDFEDLKDLRDFKDLRDLKEKGSSMTCMNEPYFLNL